MYGCEIGEKRRWAHSWNSEEMPWSGNAARFPAHLHLEGVEIEDNVFVGHKRNVLKRQLPPCHNAEGELQTQPMEGGSDPVCKGSRRVGSTILSNMVTIGENAILGREVVVTKDVPRTRLWLETQSSCGLAKQEKK